jgi:toxin ParE1/3/4
VKVYYTRAAERDLIEIGAYIVTQWGEAQWTKYSALLAAACEEIVPRNVRIALAVPGRPELLRWRCEHHMIYFRRMAGGIEIVRVLHERMLPRNHL